MVEKSKNVVGVQIDPEVPKYNENNDFPFGSTLETPWWRYIQIGIFSVTIAPIRVILVIILCCFNALLYGILRAFSTDEEMEKIFQKSWQKIILKLLTFSSRLQLFFFGVVVTFKGRLASPEEAPVIIAVPHTSIVDSWAIGACSNGRKITFLTTADYNNIFKVGAYGLACHPIVVNKNDPESRTKTLAIIKDRAKSPGVYPQTIISPEGTTGNGKSLFRFKTRVYFQQIYNLKIYFLC
jgi:hypothetical protein